MRVAIVGLGLIGGSFAKAVKAKTDYTVCGLDTSPAVLEDALQCGAVDEAITGDFSSMDLTLVALYPADAVEFLKNHIHSFKPGSTVIDLCGVKRVVCAGAEALFADSDVTFIGGHPMAGRECSGFSNADADLFAYASMILTPFHSTPNSKITPAEAFFRRLGFSQVVRTTDVRHDEIIAYTSQLAHVVSSAYIKSPTAKEYMGFSAGSFHDMTRVAKLNEMMWTELFLDNREYLAGQIDIVIQNLSAFRNAIASGDGDGLRAMLREGREIKERLG